MRRQDAEVRAGTQNLGKSSGSNTAVVALASAREALAAGDVRNAALALQTGMVVDRLGFLKLANRELCELVWLSERRGLPIEGLTAKDLQEPLEHAAEQNDARALFTLGRALCSITCGPNAPRSLVSRQDMRRGVALLVRAASAGCADAWLHLYVVTSSGPASVKNLKMAQFCRSKAAAAGLLESSS